MLKLFNSLSRKIEKFKPLNPPHVGMYTCGPTVYQFAHIGNFRAYFTSDILVRVLRLNNLDVNFVMNITDVGHLTNDQEGGADTGEDKVEKTAKKEGKTVWEVAEFYTDTFLKDYESLNLTKPTLLAKATDHIKEQIELIKQLEEKDFIYDTSDGVYFDTSKFKDYGKLSVMDQIKEGARVEVNDEKKNPRDFALWKFTPKGESRQMEWKSPWGKGFPGWHIECSAMSMKYVGQSLDIHTGGVDHREIHHPNEIAQSEAASGQAFSKYWVHTAFMLVAGEKMSKSLGNTYRLYDLEKSGYYPMSLRYLYLQTHYRKEMNFTFDALDAAENALKKLLQDVSLWDEPRIGCAEYEERFFEAVNNDLNMPEALAIMWEMVRSDKPSGAKAKTLFKMDEVLGLNILENSQILKYEQGIVPEHIKEMLSEREKLRREKRFNLADQMRAKIEKLGYVIEDGKKGPKVRKV
jgi:cysteinyl-tRNA synthetase